MPTDLPTRLQSGERWDGDNAEVLRALMAVVEACRAYLPPDGISADEFINRVLGATDNPRINPIISEIENGCH